MKKTIIYPIYPTGWLQISEHIQWSFWNRIDTATYIRHFGAELIWQYALWILK